MSLLEVQIVHVPSWVWLATLGLLIALFAVDLFVVARRPHTVSMREASLWTAFYVALAAAFGVGLLVVSGGEAAGEFFAGWLTEYSLSVDNLFIFLIIMTRFAVPQVNQQTVLMVGILIALVMRGIMIAAGAAVITRFSWVFYVFGAFLIYTAWKLARQDNGDEDYRENAAIRGLRRIVPTTTEYSGARLFVRADGRRLATPMLVVMVAIGTTDLLFALDSIPAIFGLTQEPYIVFTANAFALMGLRQLYFLLGGLLERLVYLHYGLAIVLGFIGIKLVLEALHSNALPFVNGGQHVAWAPQVPIWLSLAVIVVTLAITTAASLRRTRVLERQPVASPGSSRD